jgi:hypothetical protein
MDRVEPPGAIERNASELGRAAARLDHFAQQFSGFWQNYNTFMDLTADDIYSFTPRVFEREWTFLELLHNRLVVYDRRLGRYRANIREQPGFDQLWADSWLRTRFSAAFDDEASSLEILDYVQVSLDILLPLLLLLVGGVLSRLRIVRLASRQRANILVRGLRRRRLPVVVNIGGAGASHEPANAININNQAVGRNEIPNLIREDGANIGNLFPPGSVDRIEGHNMAPGVVDWNRAAPGCYTVLREGGTFEYYYRGANTDALTLAQALRDAGFRTVTSLGPQALREAGAAVVGVGNVLVRAIK